MAVSNIISNFSYLFIHHFVKEFFLNITKKENHRNPWSPVKFKHRYTIKYIFIITQLYIYIYTYGRGEIDIYIVQLYTLYIFYAKNSIELKISITV